jgi:hypothetical protein
MSFKPKGELHHPDATPEERSEAERRQTELNQKYENGVGAWNMDDFYVIAANSGEEAREFYVNELDGTLADGFPIQIEDLDAHHIALLDENDKPSGQVITYREAIRALHKVPEILCQTEI